MAKVFVFDNKIKLKEMLILRSVGYRTVALGRRYNVDRSAISHQCLKWGIRPGTLYDPIPKTMKYAEILLEPVNNGKSYKDYLKDQKRKTWNI